MKKESPIIPTRLKIARKMAGLSLEDLSRKLGGRVTRQALSKYEQGRMSPSPEIQNELEKVLDLKAKYSETSFDSSSYDKASGGSATNDWGAGSNPSSSHPHKMQSRIMYGDEQNLVNCMRAPNTLLPPHTPIAPLPPNTISYLEFRKTAPLAKKKQEALKQLALEYLARYEDLEKILGSAIEFQNPVPGIKVRTVEEIETAADAVRDCWNLGLAPIGNFLELLEANGIKVFEIRGLEGTENFDGMAARSDRGYVIALNMNRPADRIRFTAAHELAHIVCGFNGEGEKERLCHVFAGALLLPKPALAQEFVHRRKKLTLWELGAIKDKYGISLQAIMHRARDLDFITARHLRDFMANVKYNGWSIDEPVRYKGREEAVRFKRLLNYAVAERIIGMDQAAAFAGTTVSRFKNEVGAMI